VTIGAWTRQLPRLVAALQFALLLAVPAAAHADHHPEPSEEPVSCTGQVDGWPAFSILVDVSYTIYDGDNEYTILGISSPRGDVVDDGDATTFHYLTDFTGGGQVVPEGPPYVTVDAGATMVRLRWDWRLWALGLYPWFVDGTTPVSCQNTDYVGA
jgi:hypothetical protein